MDFRNWNISAKLGLVLILFLCLILLNFFGVYLYTADKGLPYDALMIKANENPLFVDKISLINSQFIQNGDTSRRYQIRNFLKKHDENISLLMHGGNIDMLGDEVRLSPLSEKNKEQLSRIHDFWTEYSAHYVSVSKKKVFLASIGQYYRWNEELKEVMIQSQLPREMYVELYKIQDLMWNYIRKDASNYKSLIKQLDQIDASIHHLDEDLQSEFRQVWVNLRYYMRTLTDNHDALDKIHFMQTNAPYVQSMEIEFANELAISIAAKKKKDQLVLFIGLVIVLAINLLLTVIGFRYIKHYIIEPINDMSKSAQMISDGFSNVRFKKQYNDEIGLLSQHLNEMLIKLNKLKARSKKDLRKDLGSKVNKN